MLSRQCISNQSFWAWRALLWHCNAMYILTTDYRLLCTCTSQTTHTGAHSMTLHIPAPWQPILEPETHKPYYERLQQFLEAERQEHIIFPPQQEVFAALDLTPYERVRVLLLGQDPYHDHNQAHGLCFSVRPGIAPPPSLVNIYK